MQVNPPGAGIVTHRKTEDRLQNPKFHNDPNNFSETRLFGHLQGCTQDFSKRVSNELYLQ